MDLVDVGVVAFWITVQLLENCNTFKGDIILKFLLNYLKILFHLFSP